MIRTRSRTVAVLSALALTLSLAACGGGDDASTDDTVETDDTTATDDTTSTDDTTATDDTVGAPEVDTDTSMGTCQVDVTGDVETSFSAGGGVMAVNTEYWLTPEQKEMFGDGFYFIINCSEDNNDYFGLLAGSNGNADTVPYGPATYTLEPSDALFGGAGENSPLTIMLTFEGDEGVWGVAEPGTVEITSFDDEHIAGTVSFAAQDNLADMAGTPERNIQVEVSFDFANPN